MQRKSRKKASKVDYSLLIKREILAYLEALKNKDYTVGQLDKSMKKLFSMGDLVVSVCLSKLKESDEELAPIVCYALEYANDHRLVGPLMDILVMPQVSDRVKARILAVLSHYGVDTGDLPLDDIMSDFEKIATQSLTEMIDDINRDYFLIPYILDDLQEFPPDVRLAYIRDIGEHRLEKAVVLLEILAKTDDVPVAEEAARALGRIKTGRALHALNRLSREVTNDRVKKTVERESLRLKFSGVIEEPYDPPVAFKKPTKIVLSSVDGLGSRALWIAWRNPAKNRKLCSMNLLMNSSEGIKDCWSISQITGREFNNSVRDLSRSTVVMETNAEHAVSLIRDAYYWNCQLGNPAPYQFFFWKGIIEQSMSCRITPKVYRPDFSEYDLKAIRENRDYFKDTFDLFNYRLFEDWFVAEPRVYDYAEEHKSKNGYYIKKMTVSKAENLFARFTSELIEPRAAMLRRMLELAADFLNKMGERELVKVVLSAMMHMDIKPLHHHPFIQRMVIESLRVALVNMKNGFDMRVNPEAFD
ncbi:HEAT repeat domain-containing protein [Thermosediminibacter litoriperuensis]|uniref:HEAT repeat protein n=1 Tax=Thermosediminibacter litoriperuensis TaxID=291989 RepID=A0A5S5AG95_9FIRM|nr:HEAT repeat domain-containing protein [Thermosediminibacter litoriperuensis]TYP49275.1 HEAT repeat protein [Thermosediminibacter litoriperuensis]